MFFSNNDFHRFLFTLYRYKKRFTNEKNYNKKIENLYNTINKYGHDDYLEHLEFIDAQKMKVLGKKSTIYLPSDSLTSKKFLLKLIKMSYFTVRKNKIFYLLLLYLNMKK